MNTTQSPTRHRRLWVAYAITAHLVLLVLLLHAVRPSPYTLQERIVNVIDRPVGALLHASGLRPDPNVRPERSQHFTDRLAYHMRGDELLPDGRWLLLGDSLIEGLPANALDARAVNYGIGSDDATGVLERIKMYSSAARAEALLIAVGINDLNLFADDDVVLFHYGALLDALPEGPVVACSLMLPIDESARSDWKKRSNARIQRVNEHLRTECQQRGLTIIDASSVMQTTDGSLNPLFHEGDGLHLSPQGYAAWIPVLRAGLRSALR